MKDGLCVATVSGGGQWGNRGMGAQARVGTAAHTSSTVCSSTCSCPTLKRPSAMSLNICKSGAHSWPSTSICQAGTADSQQVTIPQDGCNTLCVLSGMAPHAWASRTAHRKRMRQTFSTSMCPLTPAAAMRPSKSSKDPPPRACHVGTGHRSGRGGGPGRCRQGDFERTEGRDCCNRWCAQVGHVPPPALPVQAGAESRLPAT
jgi:hypothetical protein